jgi:hypothetical protein
VINLSNAFPGTYAALPNVMAEKAINCSELASFENMLE